MPRLNIGKEAPDFELPNQDGEMVRLSDYLGKQDVVLFFYPKDETPGCIKEVCAFRDEYEVFSEMGAEVIGISADSVESHKLFVLNRRLPFQLLSDSKNKVRKLYDVQGSLLGLIPGRETFVISREGIVKHRFSSQTRIDGHIEEAKEVLRELNGEHTRPGSSKD